jgi:hypothetical protein
MEGSFSFVISCQIKQWPASSPTTLFSVPPLPNIFVTATARTDGAIRFEVKEGDSQPYEIASAILTLSSKQLLINVNWSPPDDLSVFANGFHIASSTETIDGPIDMSAPKPRQPVDFSEQNLKALTDRTEKEKLRQARPGRRLRSLEEEIVNLSTAAFQLRDLLLAIQDGNFHHGHGALAIIRSLAARGGANFQPLLQRVAGRLNKALIAYAAIYKDDPIAGSSPSVDYRFDLLSVPDKGDEAAIDFDVWLNTIAIQRGSGEHVSQNQLIRLFADTMGSHFDPDADPISDELAALQSFSNGQPVPFAIVFAQRIGTCVCNLAGQLLIASQSAEQQNTSAEGGSEPKA